MPPEACIRHLLDAARGLVEDRPVLAQSIKDLVATVQAAIDEGKTKEQAQEMKDYVLKWDPIVKKAPDFYQILGGKGIGRIYDVLNPPPEEVKPKKKKKKLVNTGE